MKKQNVNSRDKVLDVLHLFKKESAERYGIMSLGILGSTAHDDADENGDIDVVVKLEKQDLFNIIGIKQDLEKRLHLPVDIISYRDKMNTFLKNRIDKDAIYV